MYRAHAFLKEQGVISCIYVHPSWESTSISTPFSHDTHMYCMHLAVTVKICVSSTLWSSNTHLNIKFSKGSSVGMSITLWTCEIASSFFFFKPEACEVITSNHSNTRHKLGSEERHAAASLVSLEPEKYIGLESMAPARGPLLKHQFKLALIMVYFL